ncbi:MAG: EI24 domain-containing protein [Bdellovibrionales bacterium]|jgi:CysZ protein|nr:EI24 domain-containing protein [Bdellovibrionales bacterium]
MKDFFFGLLVPYHGFKRIFGDSKLRALSIVPLAVSVFVGAVLTVVAIYALAGIIGYFSIQVGALLSLAPGGFWLGFITFLMWPIGLLIVGASVYVTVRLIAAPFYAYLAEQTLVRLGARQDKPFVLREWLWLSCRMLAVSLIRAVLFVLAGCILFAVSLIPGLNVVATIGFMYMVAFDISDYGFEAMEWSLSQRFQHVRKNRISYSGVAFGMGAAMLVPGLNLVLLPAAIVGSCEVLQRTTANQIATDQDVAEQAQV